MTKTFLLQAVTEDSHVSAVREVLGIPDPERVLIGAAFLNEGGLSILHDLLVPIAQQATVVTGIRNGITSAQGLKRCLEIGCRTYAVDTGSRAVLFHPKIYLSRNASEARLIVGSANLTHGGLNSNVEASILLKVARDEPEWTSLVTAMEDKIDGMIAEYPEHVVVIADNADIERLLVSGRVVDESITPGPITSGSSIRPDLDTISRMPLKTTSIARPRIERFPIATPDVQTIPPPVGGATPVQERLALVWQSNPLTRRDLTIPTGSNTNRTGSMLFGRGAMDGIDHRHYFRDQVFANLDWQSDAAAGRGHLERAQARFQFVIRDVSYGIFNLRLSHNSRTDTKSYEQRNSMTQLHWGGARRIIASETLLERTLYMYRDEGDRDLFVLEID